MPSLTGHVVQIPDQAGVLQSPKRPSGAQRDDRLLLKQLIDQGLRAQVRTGNLLTGRQYVALEFMPKPARVAFDATAETTNTIFADGKAVVEGDFVGRHVGEFAGIPATNKDVRVPMCVVYDLEYDQIKRGRVYFEMPVLLRQLGIGS